MAAEAQDVDVNVNSMAAEAQDVNVNVNVNANAKKQKIKAVINTVVKVFSTQTKPNSALPWHRRRQVSCTSTGFIVSGRRVVANAECLHYHTQVRLKKRGSDTKYRATVLAIGSDCNLALLTVAHDDFWEGLTPVRFGELPTLLDAVRIVGFPSGGNADAISVSTGVVCRAELMRYTDASDVELLTLLLDTPLAAANIGAPAFNDDGHFVAVACDSSRYLIPAHVVTHFLTDYDRSGRYTGFPSTGVLCQKMENPHLRSAMGMGPHHTGVRVSALQPTAPLARFLRPSDILLSFDGVQISDDGTVPFAEGERVSFAYLASMRYTGDRSTLKILRDSHTLEFDVQLTAPRPLVPPHIGGQPPSYYIIAGLVWTVLTAPYLRAEEGSDYLQSASCRFLIKLLHGMPQTEDEEVVILSHVLAADINSGYEFITNTTLVSFNGVPVRNLKQLAELVEGCTDKFLQFELDLHRIVVLDTEAAKAATPHILATHCIPAPFSPGLLTPSP